MNNTQRKKIEIIVGKLEEIREELDNLQSEEQDKADNLPDGERKEKIEEMAGYLESASGNVDYALDELSNTQE